MTGLSKGRSPSRARLLPGRCGAVAQLGERCNGIAEVRGSIPLGSTNPFAGLKEPAALQGAAGFFVPVWSGAKLSPVSRMRQHRSFNRYRYLSRLRSSAPIISDTTMPLLSFRVATSSEQFGDRHSGTLVIRSASQVY